MKKNLLKKWNQGFTLVEVVIAVGIASLALLSIGGFMAVSARSFSSTSAEVNLQHESQLAYNQLQDLVVDAQLGVTQASTVGGTETVIDANVMMDDSADQKAIYIYNTSDVYKVFWNNPEDRLYYLEYDVTIDPSGNAVLGAARGTDALMAEYITDFDLDLSLLESKRIVGVHMTFEKSNKSYDANYNITIRNEVVVNKPMADAYVTPPPTIPATSIDPIAAILVEPGSVYTFPAPTVRSSSVTEIPSQVVRWFIDSTTPVDAGTTIGTTSGQLKISDSESHDSFKIKVVTDDGSASTLVDVNVRKVTSVGVTYEAVSKDKDGNFVSANKLTKNDEFKLKATVAMNHEEELSAGVSGRTLAQAKELDWAIMEGDAYLEEPAPATITANIWPGKMKASVTTDKTLRVRATAKHSLLYKPTEGVFGEWTGTTFMKPNDFNILIDSDFERGQEYAFNIADSNPATGHIYLFDLIVRKKIVDEDGIISYEPLDDEEYIVRAEGGNNVKLHFPQNSDPYAEYVVDVSCYKFWNEANKNVISYGFLKDYSGFNISNAVGESHMDAIGLEVSELCFDSMYNNPLSLIKYYTPRTYSERLNDTTNTNFTVGGITNFRMAYGFNLDRKSIKWDYYTNPTGGKSKDAFIKYAPGNNCLDRLFSNDLGGNNLNLYFSHKKWSDNTPQVLYLIPTIYLSSGDQHLMYHTYIKQINYNIEVPINGTTHKLYFPYPLCEKDGLKDFPGKSLVVDTTDPSKAKLEKATWYNAYYSSDFNNLYYSLQRWADSSGVTNYTLTLYSQSTYTETYKIGSYRIQEGQFIWSKE